MVGLRQFKQAFTLIELLVVVAIIALLISILLPSLSAARAIARTVKCSASLKQLGAAHVMYANENGDWFAPVRLNQAPCHWYQNIKFRQIMGFTVATSATPSLGNRFPEDFQCPDVPADQKAVGGSATWNWGMNSSTQSATATTLTRPHVEMNQRWARGDRITNDSTTGNNANLVRISGGKVVQPSAKLLMIDASAHQANRANSDWRIYWDLAPHTRGTSAWPGPVGSMTAYRHNESANVLFVDGHVQTLHKTEVWTLNASGGVNAAPSQRLWFVYRKN